MRTPNPNTTERGEMLNLAKTIGQNVVKNQLKEKATTEFLKTSVGKTAGKATYHGFKNVVDKVCGTQLGKTVVSKSATGVAGKSLYGAASRTVVSSTMKGCAIGAGVGFVINSTVDAVGLCRGKQSGKEFAKNMGKNAVETGGSLAGSGIGAAVGSLICPGVGTAVGGFLGGLIGGIGARASVD